VSESSANTDQPVAAPLNPDLAVQTYKLDLSARLRQNHHDAIWEEQRHFTWWISIILSAQLLILTTTKIARPEKVALISVASLVGILLALTGFLVQRREGVYFHRFNLHFTQQYNSAYPTEQLPTPGPDANKSVPNLVLSAFIGKCGVRDYFQFLLLAFTAIFVGIAIYGYIAV